MKSISQFIPGTWFLTICVVFVSWAPDDNEDSWVVLTSSFAATAALGVILALACSDGSCDPEKNMF